MQPLTKCAPHRKHRARPGRCAGCVTRCSRSAFAGRVGRPAVTAVAPLTDRLERTNRPHSPLASTGTVRTYTLEKSFTATPNCGEELAARTYILAMQIDPSFFINRRFGRAVVIEQAAIDAFGLPTWRCQCDCGREYIAQTNPIIHRSPTPCPCPPATRRRLSRPQMMHGMSRTRAYRVWCDLRRYLR